MYTIKVYAVFGKTCEDVRKHTDIRFETEPDKAERKFASFKFKRYQNAK